MNAGTKVLDKIEHYKDEIDEMLLKVISDRIEQGLKLNESKKTLEGLSLLYNHLRDAFDRQ